MVGGCNLEEPVHIIVAFGRLCSASDGAYHYTMYCLWFAGRTGGLCDP